MYHIGLQQQNKSEIDYSTINKPEIKEAPEIPDDDSLPQAPDGFVFYRIQSGDTLVSLSVRFGISQNKLRRYNNKVCFGHRLTHIIGKLLLIPIESTANLTSELKQQLNQIYIQDENDRNEYDENLDDRKYSEPDENGKYQLKKALMFHAKGIDEHRAAYYLGESNWNVRKALNLWKKDDKWEKQQTIMTQCQLTADEAIQLLDNYHWDVFQAINFWKNEQKKLEKITKKLAKKNKDKANLEQNLMIDNNEKTVNTEGRIITNVGSTEMQTMSKQEIPINNNDEFDNTNQGSITSGFCCGN